MNKWFFGFGILFLLFLLIIGVLLCVVLFAGNKVKGRRNKAIIISLITNIIMIAVVILYLFSHSTYYKYNDWAILHNDVHIVEQKYGKFDLGKIHDNKKGRVAYYIYTDNSPIMPDYLAHYYYMEYDEFGIVYNVYEACQPGG